MVRDPSTESWRATLGPFPIKLRETQASLAASQTDLTAALAERNEARTEAREWRATAERYLAAQEQLARELATARYRNRILTAENEAALRRLNEMEQR